MSRHTRGFSPLALLAALGTSAGVFAQTQSQGQPPVGQPAQQQPARPIQTSRPIAPGQPAANPGPTTSPQTPGASQPVPAPTPAGQPSTTPRNIGPQVQPGQVPIAQPNPGAGGGGGVVPRVQPMNIQGQQAPTPFWWGPTFGQRTVHTRGPIPGGYAPMGRPAVLTQPDAHRPPGAPERFQNELSYGPLQPPLPTIPNDDAGPIRPISDPHPQLPRDFRGGSGGDVIVNSGSGVLINGRVEGDRFRLGFTVGGSPFIVDRRGFAYDLGRSYRYGRYHFFHDGYPVYYRYDGGTYNSCYYAPVYGTLVTIDPHYVDQNVVPQQQTPAPRLDETLLPPVERGHLALERGKPKDAIAFYKEHLSLNQQDAQAMRWLAVALLQDGQPAASVAMMVMAYQTDPSLAASPLVASRMGGDSALSSRFGSAVAYANSTKGSSAYLSAAVFAQASGKPDVARKLLDKAKAAGLDRTIVGEFEAAIKK